MGASRNAGEIPMLFGSRHRKRICMIPRQPIMMMPMVRGCFCHNQPATVMMIINPHSTPNRSDGLATSMRVDMMAMSSVTPRIMIVMMSHR